MKTMSNRIEVIGSLSPEKECQDRVRVLSWGGDLPVTPGNRLQGPTKSCCAGGNIAWM